ncbi:MAG: glycosyltransferase family 2 protein [Deltaproteobacteria bacterium]|nr:glycosyltransferase family 2 protein [Candidatus Anaeroferrophillacea bacterium]
MTKSLAIVVPVFNEGSAIVDNVRAIMAAARRIPDSTVSMLLVDDGSTDGSTETLRRLCGAGEGFHLLRLTRNFGKEAAITAGLRAAGGFDAAIVMDADLQHPPELLAEMVRRWREGYDVVEACKASRGPESRLRGRLVRAYVAAFRVLTGMDIRNQSDFKLLDRRVVAAYGRLPERERFFRGLVNWMDFSTARLTFDVPATGKRGSSWSSLRLLRYAVTSMVAFTSFPLHLITVLGVVTLAVSVVFGGIALMDKICGRAIDGFTTVILLLLFIGSTLMISLGFIGIYISRIYNEVKRRPAYIIDGERSIMPETARE